MKRQSVNVRLLIIYILPLLRSQSHTDILISRRVADPEVRAKKRKAGRGQLPYSSFQGRRPGEGGKGKI